MGSVAVDFQDFAVGIDFDFAFAALGGAFEVIDYAAIVGIGVIRGHGEAGDTRLSGSKDVRWNGVVLGSSRGRGVGRGGAAGKDGCGGDEEECF